MPRTILFFGDSNTRGAAVGPTGRFAALLEAARTGSDAGEWRFVVGHSESDFRVFRERLAHALAKEKPDLLVLQCPTGPASFWIAYPPWLQWILGLSKWSFSRLTERYVKEYTVKTGARRDALYEGKFLDPLYRWNFAQWPGPRHVRLWFAGRYGIIPKVTRERYVTLMSRLRDQARDAGVHRILILGLLPHSENYYPGYLKRAAEWNEMVATALHRPDDGVVYLDLLGPLLRDGLDGLLISDGRHLTYEAHRRIAAIVAPAVERLMSDCEASAIRADVAR